MFRASMVSILMTLFLSLSVSAQETYTLEADRVTRIDNTTYRASGNVIIKARDITLDADNVTFYQNTGNVKAEGNVKIKSPTQEIEADSAEYNINTESGEAENIKGFLAPFNYICARSMTRTGPTTFTVEDARISTCSGDVPDWSVSMYKGRLELNGYMNASHATANILNSPLVYVPKLLYPVSAKRHTGFLLPDLGYLSDKGAFLALKFFWAPTVDFDMTFGLTGFSKSGIEQLAEARYAQSSVNSFYASVERIDDATSEADVNVRWRAILKNTYFVTPDLELNVNANRVSDYLFMRDFGRFSLSPYDRDNKENIFFDQARAKYYTDYADFSIFYSDNYEYRDTTQGYIKTNVQQAPSFSVNKVVTDIPFVIAAYDLGFNRVAYEEYDYKSPDTGYKNKWVYNRLNASLKLYSPIDFKYFTVTPAAGISYTRWENSSRTFNFKSYFNADFGQVRQVNSRSAERYTGSADLTVAFREIYRNYGSVRHGIQNVIEMKYSPKLIQDNLPDYIEGDRTPYYGSINYEMINFLTARNWYLKLTLDQGYDVLQEDSVLPLTAELNASFYNYVTNTFKTIYKHSGKFKNNERPFQYISDTLTLNLSEHFSLTGEYSFDTRVPSTGFNTSANLNASVSFWRLVTSGYIKWQGYNKDLSLKNLKPIEQGAAVTYLAECWSLGVEVETNSYNVNTKDGQYSRNEVIVYLNFGLRGLGGGRLQFLKTKNERAVY